MTARPRLAVLLPALVLLAVASPTRPHAQPDALEPISYIFISAGGSERQLIPDATEPALPSYRDSQAVWLR